MIKPPGHWKFYVTEGFEWLGCRSVILQIEGGTEAILALALLVHNHTVQRIVASQESLELLYQVVGNSGYSSLLIFRSS